MKLLDGCSAEDIAILLDWNQHADKIRILRSDLSYSNAHAPWILQWFILRRHRKHQLLRKSIPDLSGLRDNVLQFCSKLRWRWILQDQEGDQTLPRFKVPSTPCGKHTCNELEAWISTFRARMMSSGLSFVSRARYSMRSWSNLSGLERMAMSILRNGPHAALPNDKNTAFTLVLKQDVPTLFGNLISRRWYAPTGNLHSHDVAAIRTRYAKVCMQIGDALEHPNLGKALLRSAYVPNATFVSTLQINIKHHKDPVELRPIHATINYTFLGLATWLRNAISARLSIIAPYIVQDSRDLVRRIGALDKRLLCSDELHFIQLDVKDFFLSGSAAELVHLVASIFPDQFCALV